MPLAAVGLCAVVPTGSLTALVEAISKATDGEETPIPIDENSATLPLKFA